MEDFSANPDKNWPTREAAEQILYMRNTLLSLSAVNIPMLAFRIRGHLEGSAVNTIASLAHGFYVRL